jgi:predicted negative regulator of RcsB-dependent stress response
LLSPGLFWQSQSVRLLVVIVIIGVLIWLGWSKPFKERYAETKTTITSELNNLGKKPQKNHDSSGKRH